MRNSVLLFISIQASSYIFFITSSLITILFAQISKLTTVALTAGFSDFNLSVAPVMITGAILGGFIGTGLNKKRKEETVEKAFNGVQLLVLCVTIFNIIRNLI